MKERDSNNNRDECLHHKHGEQQELIEIEEKKSNVPHLV